MFDGVSKAHGLNIKQMKQSMLDPVTTLELIDSFVTYKYGAHCLDEGALAEPGQVVRLMAREGAKFIFRHAGSPIEKIFLNVINLAGVLSDWLPFMFERSTGDAGEYARERREFSQWITTARRVFIETTGDSSLDSFLDFCISAGYLAPEGRRRSHFGLLIDQVFGLNNACHFVLQARFPNIKVGTRSIRPDMYIFRPLDDKFNVVVECDGYRYHNSPEEFDRDRRRDRVLQLKGFDVLRYSGSEIAADPIAVVGDLVNFLETKDQAPKVWFDNDSEEEAV
ncbi:MAG TPA: DUF559 domain-containing protein [Anaerolineales bacterium]|nr:DUF559 domain-containing protein [Anaerolineales bacterium]